MMRAGRTSGSKVVIAAVIGTVGMVGIGTIYLPFLADRDTMRGMDEDGGMNQREKREMAEYLRKEGLSAAEQNSEQPKPSKPGSMWSNMRK